MSKYTEPAKQLLEHVGGSDNISVVTHCATRMRFVLKEPSKADIKKVEEIGLVKGTFTQAGQFQVIIGNDVSSFYNDFISIAGVNDTSKDDAKQAAKQNMNFLQRMIAHLADIFTPLIPAIVVGGLILGFRNIIGEIKMVEDGTKTLVEVSQFWAGTNDFLWLIGEAIFHFLPVGITWAVTRKMGATQILGIVLGITLVSPQLLNAYAVASTQEIPFWDFGFAHVDKIGYQAQVLPAIFAGLLFSFLELRLRKIIPNAISMIVVPFLALVPTVLIAHTVLGPIGWQIGSFISDVVYSGLTSSLGWLFAAVFGFAYAPLVITGLHHMTNAIDLQLMSEFNGTNLWPMIALSNIAQGSAVLAMIYINRKDEREKQVSIPATISCYLGVTEPAMFGINLKYGYPFLAAMIGSMVAGVISVGSHVMANSIGVGGLPGILSIQPQHMVTFAIAMVVAIVIPFVLTIIFAKANMGKISLKKSRA
ncbi:PTS system trehalose-specific EIIBC component [Niallia taxi]|nr:PTS system trehalose-specific EIIBC component [Niallia taxi]MDE5053674.1 PTS system trehalose-specific EIIBC component [Niallia taxi]